MDFNLVNVAHADVIADAPRVGDVLLKVLDFLLQILGILGIISLVIAGILYFAAAGDESRIELAKKMVVYVVVGLVVSMGAIVIVRQVASFF